MARPRARVHPHSGAALQHAADAARVRRAHVPPGRGKSKRMLDLIQLPPLATALAIFLLRVCDMSLDTLRVLFIVRGHRPVVWFLGFFPSAIWVVAITSR